jgi:hypothetical protein
MNAESFGECPICLASLFVLDLVDADEHGGAGGGGDASDSPVVAIPCGHLFHATCVAQLTGVQNKCPMCRADIASDDDDAANQGPFQRPNPPREFIGCRGAVKVRPVALPRAGLGGAATLKEAAPYLSQVPSPGKKAARASAPAASVVSPEERRRQYVADLRRRARKNARDRAERERDAAASGGDIAARLAALRRERDDLSELAEVGRALHGGSIRKQTDRNVLARCLSALQKKLTVSRAKLRTAGERNEALQRKAKRYEAIIADLGVEVAQLEAQLPATGAASPQQPAGAALPHHARPLEVRAPPPPVDDSDWDGASTRADPGGLGEY